MRSLIYSRILSTIRPVLLLAVIFVLSCDDGNEKLKVSGSSNPTALQVKELTIDFDLRNIYIEFSDAISSDGELVDSITSTSLTITTPSQAAISVTSGDFFVDEDYNKVLHVSLDNALERGKTYSISSTTRIKSVSGHVRDGGILGSFTTPETMTVTNIVASVSQIDVTFSDAISSGGELVDSITNNTFFVSTSNSIADIASDTVASSASLSIGNDANTLRITVQPALTSGTTYYLFAGDLIESVSSRVIRGFLGEGFTAESGGGVTPLTVTGLTWNPTSNTLDVTFSDAIATAGNEIPVDSIRSNSFGIAEGGTTSTAISTGEGQFFSSTQNSNILHIVFTAIPPETSFTLESGTNYSLIAINDITSLSGHELAAGSIGTFMPFTVTSTSYTNGAIIPNVHACVSNGSFPYGGSNASPQYAWTNPPAGTTSYALVMDDKVSPCDQNTGGACRHWGVFNIPSTTTSLDKSADISAIIGVVEGSNYASSNDYAGPCPPPPNLGGSEHTYNTEVFALGANVDTGAAMPTITAGAALTRSQFRTTYGSHILGNAIISGRYTAPSQ